MKHLTNQGTSSHWSKNHIKNQCCHKAVLHNDCPPWPHTPRDVEGYCHCITRVPKLWQLKNHLFISLSPNNYHTCMTKVHSSDQTIKSAFQFHYIFLICLKVWMNDLTAAGRVSFGSSLPWWCSPFDLVGAGGRLWICGWLRGLYSPWRCGVSPQISLNCSVTNYNS